MQRLLRNQDNRPMTFDPMKKCMLAVLGLAACSPALNWREVRPAGSALAAMFPCRPEHMVRSLGLGGAKVAMHLSACTVEGATYGVAYVEFPDSSYVAPAIEQMRAAAEANIGGHAIDPEAMKVAGMTPNPLAERWRLQGLGADEVPVQEQVGFFSRGRQVYQATVVGPKVNAEAVDTFFTGLKLDQ
jgi:hypothetical protein